MLKIWKIVAAGAGLWAVLRLFYGWKWGARSEGGINHLSHLPAPLVYLLHP
jgi:hypothetical protein